MTLALRYRPKVFAAVAGQKHVTALLYRMARRGTIPNAILLAGSRGCGKTSTARILGAALNCESGDQAADVWPCGKCPSCEAVAEGNSLDVIEVDAASNGGVEAVRGLRDLVAYGSPGQYKVVMLDEAHAMSKDAFNALLKILEEPPERTLFVLLTTEPGKILPTVESRCMTFVFRRLAPAVITDRLRHISDAEGFGAELALLDAIAERADGGMRDAVMLLDQVTSALDKDQFTLANFQALFGDADYAPRIVGAMAAGDYPAVYDAIAEAAAQEGDPGAVIARLADCLAGLLTLSCGGTVAAQGDQLEVRATLAAQLGTDRLTRAMKALWDYVTKVRVEDRQAGLKLAAVVVTEQLCPPRPKPVSAVNGHAAGGGLDELRQVMGAV
jgi:DNA polymerase-3 subunit gamma/tau